MAGEKRPATVIAGRGEHAAMSTSPRTTLSAALALLGLGACAVAPPTGPTLVATPPQGKDLARFQQEDFGCRSYASAQIGGGSPAQAANQSAVGSAAIGTALGAAAGALLGAAGGSAGTGAAIGAGSGLLLGSAVGANNAQASAGGLQGAYDTAYAQCMASNGNTVQAPPPAVVAAAPAYPGPYTAWPYGYYAPAYPAPSVSLGFGFGTGWGHRPWGYRPWGYYGPGWRRGYW
jgi:hypothetical protein